MTNGRPSPTCKVRADVGHGDGDTVDLNAPETSLLPPQLLQPGEVVILALKPSLWYVVLSPLRALSLIALMTFVLSYGAVHEWYALSVRDIVLAAAAVTAARLFWELLEWFSRVYVLTDRRVIRIRGVLRIQVFEATTKHIQHTQCLFSLRERLFGLGTIGFATAGTGVTEAYWVMLAKPLEVHARVVATLDRYR